MLELLVVLVILALVAWGGRTVIAAMGAPEWINVVIIVVVLIVAVVVIANAFGVNTPSLR